MPHALMLLGTHSSAGKSLLAAAFCRILARKGYRVAPFKAQNMSNNAGVTPEGGEMGRAQIVQAEAAGILPHTDMNPVLLKPEANRRSQIVLNGRMHGHIHAANWFDLKQMLWTEVCTAYDRLAARYDVIVLEGAGSPAEINLKAGDIVNLRMARHAGAPCLLVGDIDRGGVFAALAGTMLLLEPEERQQIHGFLINKFRGDPALLGDGLTLLQEKAFGVPTLGVIPYIPDLRIADEDAVALDAPLQTGPTPNQNASKNGAPGLEIAVIQLPHIANFDDFDPLRHEPGLRVRFVTRIDELGDPAAILLPGSKVTLSDLAWLRARGLAGAIQQRAASGTPVVGICGGYQMLGEQLVDPAGVEGPAGARAAGLGLLPVVTTFCQQKQTHRARLRLAHPHVQPGMLVEGYEIHTGETVPSNRAQSGAAAPLGTLVERSGRAVEMADGAIGADGRIWGTYLHGIFHNHSFRCAWLETLGWQPSVGETLVDEYDRLADAVEQALDWSSIVRLMGLSE